LLQETGAVTQQKAVCQALTNFLSGIESVAFFSTKPNKCQQGCNGDRQFTWRRTL
jgi:hypothetical protein